MEKGGYANIIGFIYTLIELDCGSSGRRPLGIIFIHTDTYIQEEEGRATLSVCLYIKS